MVPEIVQHGHCHVCGRVVKYGDTTCSETCKADWERSRRSRKRMMLIMYVIMAALVLMLVVGPMLSGGGGA